MKSRDKELVNALHGGFPITERPYAAIARQLAMTEEEVLERLQALLDNRTLTRFGPLYDAARLGGAFTLAAMAVPEKQFDEVAEFVNAFPEVAHNYAREHALNMWFVIGVDRPDRIDEILSQINFGSYLMTAFSIVENGRDVPSDMAFQPSSRRMSSAIRFAIR